MIDLQGNELKRTTIENLPVAPIQSRPGLIYFDTTLNKMRIRNTEDTDWLDGPTPEEIQNIIKEYAQAGDGIVVSYDATTDKLVFSVQEQYRHVQSIPAAVWIISHGMNKRPYVAIVDSSGTQYEGEVEYINENLLTVSFAVSFAGTAYLS